MNKQDFFLDIKKVSKLKKIDKEYVYSLYNMIISDQGISKSKWQSENESIINTLLVGGFLINFKELNKTNKVGNILDNGDKAIIN